MQSEALRNNVLLRRASQAARAIVVVLATFILPKSTAAAQQSPPMSGQPPVVGVTTRQFAQRFDIRSERLARGLRRVYATRLLSAQSLLALSWVGL